MAKIDDIRIHSYARTLVGLIEIMFPHRNIIPGQSFTKVLDAANAMVSAVEDRHKESVNKTCRQRVDRLKGRIGKYSP